MLSAAKSISGICIVEYVSRAVVKELSTSVARIRMLHDKYLLMLHNLLGTLLKILRAEREGNPLPRISY
jgi:hypothetical protein